MGEGSGNIEKDDQRNEVGMMRGGRRDDDGDNGDKCGGDIPCIFPVFIEKSVSLRAAFDQPCSFLLTCSSPRRTFFLHALSCECTSKLCITFLNQFSVYFHI